MEGWNFGDGRKDVIMDVYTAGPTRYTFSPLSAAFFSNNLSPITSTHKHCYPLHHLNRPQNPRPRFPHKTFLRRNPSPTMRSHIDHDIINLLPSKLLIQAKTHGRCFDVSPGVVAVCGREALADEHCAETLALVGWEDDQEMENSEEAVVNDGSAGCGR